MEQNNNETIAAARVLADRSADACGVNREDNWKIYSDDFVADAKAALDAANCFAAAPAVDAAKLQALPVDAAELGKLKSLAEAATPGEWMAGGTPCATSEDALQICAANINATAKPSDHFFEVYLEDGRRTALVGNGPTSWANCDFIAAANPAAILRIAALVAQLEADAEKYIDALVESSEAVAAEAAEVKRLESLVAQQAARLQQMEDAADQNSIELAVAKDSLAQQAARIEELQQVPGEVGEIKALRNGQSERVMPLIGPMLDALNGLPNDTREALKDEARTLFKHLTAIRSAVEDDGTAPRKGGFQLTRSIIHECPALRLPQSFLEKLGNTAQIVVLKGADDKIAKFITDACNAHDFSTQEGK